MNRSPALAPATALAAFAALVTGLVVNWARYATLPPSGYPPPSDPVFDALFATGGVLLAVLGALPLIGVVAPDGRRYRVRLLVGAIAGAVAVVAAAGLVQFTAVGAFVTTHVRSADVLALGVAVVFALTEFVATVLLFRGVARHW